MIEVETLSGETMTKVTNPWYRAFLTAHNNRRHVRYNPTYLAWLREMMAQFLSKGLGWKVESTTTDVRASTGVVSVTRRTFTRVHPRRDVWEEDDVPLVSLYFPQEFTAWLMEEVKQSGCYRVAELMEAV